MKTHTYRLTANASQYPSVLTVTDQNGNVIHTQTNEANFSYGRMSLTITGYKRVINFTEYYKLSGTTQSVSVNIASPSWYNALDFSYTVIVDE